MWNFLSVSGFSGQLFLWGFFQYSDRKICLGFFLSRSMDFFGLGQLEDEGSHRIPQQTNTEVEPDDEQIFPFLLS